METGSNCSSCSKCCACKCMCHRFVGFLVMLIGVTFLLGTLDVISAHMVSMTWPILLILIGFKKSFMKGMCKCCCQK